MHGTEFEGRAGFPRVGGRTGSAGVRRAQRAKAKGTHTAMGRRVPVKNSFPLGGGEFK